MELTSIQPNRYKYRVRSGGQQKNIYHYDAELARAFQSDCEDFLDKFRECKDLSFTAFSRLWREVNFLCIFKDLEYILLLQAFIENCFFITKKFLFSSDLSLQTGAVYILYALYYKQPIKGWVKIRVTQCEFEKLNEIVEIQKANRSLDVVFICNKMRIDEAFQYCAISQPRGLEAKFLRRVDLSLDDVGAKHSKDSALQKFRNLMEAEPDLVSLEETDDEYQRLADKYKEKCGSLFVFPTKVGESLKRAYSQVFHMNVEEEKESEEGQGAKTTKNKAVSNVNATYRGDRKVVTAIDLQKASTSNGNIKVRFADMLRS